MPAKRPSKNIVRQFEQAYELGHYERAFELLAGNIRISDGIEPRTILDLYQNIEQHRLNSRDRTRFLGGLRVYNFKAWADLLIYEANKIELPEEIEYRKRRPEIVEARRRLGLPWLPNPDDSPLYANMQ